MKTYFFKSLLFSVAGVFILSTCASQSGTLPNAQPSGSGIRQAAIAIPDGYSANVAEEILLAGGNAVDAAVATGFALAVTYIDAGNIGGGGFMLIYMDGKPYFLDFRETAPSNAHRLSYLLLEKKSKDYVKKQIEKLQVL